MKPYELAEAYAQTPEEVPLEAGLLTVAVLEQEEEP